MEGRASSAQGRIGREDAPGAGGTMHFAGAVRSSESPFGSDDIAGLEAPVAGAMSMRGAALFADAAPTTDFASLRGGIGQ